MENLLSKAKLGFGGTYRYKYNPTSSAELTNFDSIVIHYGLIDGVSRDLYMGWDKDTVCGNDPIIGCMSFSKLWKLKRELKLLQNGSRPKEGELGYNTA